MLRPAFNVLRCLLHRAGFAAARLAGATVLLAALAALAAPSLSQHASAQAQTITDVRPSRAVPGQTIKIYGSGFSLESTVTIGGQSTEILDVLLDGTVLKTQVPADVRGPVDIQVGPLFDPAVAPDVFTVVRGGPGSPWNETNFFSDTDNATNPYAVATGDVTGDGVPDAMIGLLSAGRVELYPGDGAGGFAESPSFSQTVQYPRDVVLADVIDDGSNTSAGDGDLDVIVGAGSNSSSDGANEVRIYVNNGDNSFSTQTAAQSSDSPIGDVRSIAHGDVDGDGDIDLVVASSETDQSSENGTLTLLRNDDGDITFSASDIGNVGDPRSVVLTDVNGDGAPDLLVADHLSPGSVLFYPNDGTGTFQSPTDVIGDLDNPISIDVGDFDGDGFPGVLVGQETTGRALAAINNSGAFETVLSVASELSSVRAVHAADVFGGDGQAEAVVSSQTDGAVFWVPFDSGSFGTRNVIDGDGTPGDLGGANDLTTADIDADGDLDLLALITETEDGGLLFDNGASPPSISNFPTDQAIFEDPSPAPTYSFSASDEEDGSAPSVASAFSTNESLVLSSDVAVNGPDSDGNYSLSVSPRPDSNSAAPSSPTDIVVELQDSDGNVASASFTLTVDPINDRPVATADTFAVDEDNTLSVTTPGLLGNDSDVDYQDPLSVTSVPVAVSSNGSLTLNSDGSFTYTPNADYDGTDGFAYELVDGNGATDTASVTINVNPVNDKPTIGAVSNQTIDEDQSVGPLTPSASDVETPTSDLTYTGISSNQTLVPDTSITVLSTSSGPEISATPLPDSNGVTTLSVVVEDGGGLTDTTSFDLTVNSVNDAPVLSTNAGLTLDEDAASTLTSSELQAEDVEDGPSSITFNVTTSPQYGTLRLNGSALNGGSFTQQDVNDGLVTYEHDGSETTSDSFVFDVIDSASATGVSGETFSISINPVPDPPQIESVANQIIDEDQSLTLNGVQVSDPDTPLSDLTVTASSDNGDLVPNSSPALSVTRPTSDGIVDVTVTPPADSNSAAPTGTATITLEVSDGSASSTESFVLTVNPLNDVPTASSDSYTTTEDQPLSVSAPGVLGNDNDVDFGDNLTVTTTPASPPSSGTVTLNADGSFTYSPDTNFSGSDSFTYEVTDDSGAVAQASVSINVDAANDPPSVASIADQTIDEDGSLSLTGIQLSDPDTPVTDLIASASTDNPNLVPSSGLSVSGPDSDGLVDLTVTPAADSNGTATITLTASDGTSTVSASFTLTVTAVNDAPTVTSIGDQTIDEDKSTGTLAFTVGDVETVPSNLSLTATSSNASVIPDSNLTLGGSGSDRTIEAVPLPDSSGSASITIVVSDGATTATTSFNVTVNPVPDPPEATFQAATDVTATSATLTGSVTPLDASTDAEFVVEPSDGSTSPQILAAGTGLTGSEPISVQATASKLTAATEYTVFLRATNSVGTVETSSSTFTTVDPLSVPASISFYTVGVDSRRVRSVSLENTQSTALTISSLTIGGQNPGAFRIVGAPSTPFDVAAGETVTVEVRYAPTSADGEQTATLEVQSDLETEIVSLEGTAVPRRGLAYGRVPVQRPAQQSLTVTNPLPTAVSVTGVEISGPDAPAFTLPDDVTGTTIDDGGSLALPVSLSAGSSRAYEAVLTLETTADVRVVDLTARALGLTVTTGGDGTPDVGSSVPIRVDVPEAISPSSATLFFRRTGAAGYDQQSFPAAAGQTAEASIPARAVTPSGVQYYVQVTEESTDGTLQITHPARSPAARPAGIATRIRSIAAQGRPQPRQYRMVSIPVRPDTSVAAVLTASYNFGPYDPSEWRAFRYPPSLDARRTGNTTVEQIGLQEFPDIDGLSRSGTAFWHVTQTGTPLSVRNATSVDPSEPQTVRLEPGWNQIGTPFPFAVSWQTVLDSTRAALTDSTARTALADVSAPVAWTGERYQYDRQVLNPWSGYFVFNPTPDQPIDLRIPPVRASASSAPAAKTAAHGSPAEKAPSIAAIARERLSSDESADADSTKRSKGGESARGTYRLQLRARTYVESLERTLTDDANWVGMLEGARAGSGPEDVVEPPSVGNYLRLSVLRDDAAYIHQSGNFKPLTSDGHAWDLEVAARVREQFYTDKTVTVQIREVDALPDGFRLYVLDKDDGRLLPTDGGSFDVTLTREHPTRHLRLIAGRESFAQKNSDGIPLESFDYALKGNYPNPFDGTTTIAYQLKKRTDVRVTIYDVLGRRVRTLADGEDQVAGPHEMTWDGRNALGRPVASGVYLYRIEAGSFSATGKMTVVR